MKLKMMNVNDEKYLKKFKSRYQIRNDDLDIDKRILYTRDFIKFLKINFGDDKKYLFRILKSDMDCLGMFISTFVRNHEWMSALKERQEKGLDMFCDSCGEMFPYHYSGCKGE